MANSAECFLRTLVVIGILSQVTSDAFDHKYNKGDPVPLYVNKVGPYCNPSETYPYYDFPFCPPDLWQEKEESLGEVLNGDRLVSAPYKLNFRLDRESQVVCRRNLTRKEVALFQTAVAKDYYLQMYYDDLPIWQFIGVAQTNNVDTFKYYLFTKVHFDIFYSRDHVIEINMSSDSSNLADLTEDKVIDIEFLYSVNWKETDLPFDTRMQKYTMFAHFPLNMKKHQFAITNSFWTIILLVGCLVALYVRVLRKDFNEYENDEELADNQGHTGWKIIHGDVFRYPKYKCCLAAAIGCGTQLFAVVLSVIIVGVAGVFHPYDRGVQKVASVIIYAITNVIAGFTAVSFYHQLEGSYSAKNLFLAGSLFCGPLFLTFCFLNTVAGIYESTAEISMGNIVKILLIWVFIALPLLLLGGTLGKMTKSEFQAPCRSTKCPREIPPLRWYRAALPQMAIAGFLPFSVFYIELYPIFASIWGFKEFTAYGVLCVFFIFLVTITALVSIGLTYLQLAAEDHQWWWRSFLCGGSTGLYVYAYCFFFYFQSEMSGFLQTSFFFGYMTCSCFGLFLLLGTVGFRASLIFVRHIYSSIKFE
ncbi:transmembrane 9 superfamily member 2-like isoform X2 [Coffea arabica]|nr:transmembrane 9 superfamily member 2-like isoform X2 [Coffea arabica]XP_027100736.1 transmembrane 9 superfamily member 2-like isoform X2 [Coffea arabica]XP_027100737.1 transmembrane 9 superfamily member 2-like isoform X2 [Coffea arabica]XP_027100738.1 transmembrane 9 superfamily member 2-like isoform X2 [Coffea arabica]